MLYPFANEAGKNRQVVMTGCGIATALGHGWDINARGFRSGASAFREVRGFDVSRQRVRRAAEMDLPALGHGRLGRSTRRRMDRGGAMLVQAGDEVMAQSGWGDSGTFPVVLGTSCGGMTLGQDYFRAAIAAEDSRRQPARAVFYQAQRQGYLLAESIGTSGPVSIISNACASGANAVGHAWELVRAGIADRVLAGGYDALSQLVFAGFDSLQALSATTCRPFDHRRDGLGLGEGVALFALESRESATSRGAHILGEVAGYSAATDCHHLTQPHPEGCAAVQTMTGACRVAGVSPGEVDYINAHGTGTPLNDAAEAVAINTWAGREVAGRAVSSTKASIGHLLGAAGAVEVAVCLMAMQGGWRPPTLTCEERDPACQFRVVTRPEDADVRVALTNSFGFGGANATLVLRRAE